MPTSNEPIINSSFVLNEDDDFKFSREQGVLISGQNLGAGTVLGKITASGKWTILAPAAADGSQTAAGVLFDAVNASAGDQPCVVYVRHAILKSNGLTWPGGITTPQKATAIGQLAALQMTIRTDVGTAATGVVG